jgi:hypothetical protein
LLDYDQLWGLQRFLVFGLLTDQPL